MIKKALFVLLMSFSLAVAPLCAASGQWRLHPFFVASQLKNVIDTRDKVYYLTCDNIFCFDKETQETEPIDKSNYLNDVQVENIYFNNEKEYLVVVYRNSALDIILKDGQVVNMTEIKDAIITSGKGINDVTFTRDGAILVATQFGYVVIDDSRFVIKESHLYNKNVSSIAQVGTSLVAVVDGVIGCSPVASPHDVATAFISTGKEVDNARLRPINGSSMFVIASGNLYLGTLGGSSASPSVMLVSQVAATADNVQQISSGFLANFMAEGFYYTFDKNGGAARRSVAKKELYSSYAKGDGTLWAVGTNGLHVAADAANYYKPFGVTVAEPFWMVYNEGLDKVYVHTSADNYAKTSSSNCRVMRVSAYDGSKWVDETPDKLGTDPKDYSAYPICVNPKDPHTYVFSVRGVLDGGASTIYKVRDGKTVDRYTNATAPGGYYRGATAFDSGGNLWVVYSQGKPSDASNVIVLPSAKVNSTAQVTKNDWKKVDVRSIESGEFKRASFCISKGDVKIYCDGGYERPIFFWKDNMNTVSPTVRSYKTFTDQDGKSVTWTYMRYMALDKNDRLWFTTAEGIVSMNPADALSDGCTVNHIKVPRNDGTDLADYLLEGMTINCIAVDNQNRKWIGTAVAGVYQVSEDGSQILQHFNVDNSMLPSNTVYSIVCTGSGSVFMLTDCGLVEYKPGGGGAASGDLSNVYCYPNPVRPDFLGVLTIAGLTDNALVKIADSAGNVIKQIKSSGGTATWDCCDSDGNRVASGVYYVLASNSGDGSSGSIVSKFLVVK